MLLQQRWPKASNYDGIPTPLVSVLHVRALCSNLHNSVITIGLSKSSLSTNVLNIMTVILLSTCDMVTVWLSLGSKISLLGLEKDHTYF